MGDTKIPRNGSGQYSLPPIYLAVPGTTIQAQQHNDPLADIASALTGSVAANGETPMTGALKMGANKITGLAAATLPSDAVRFDQISDPSAIALATLQTYGWAVVGNAPTLANIDATTTASGQYRFVTGASGTFPTGVVAADTGQIIMVREDVNEGSMVMAVGAGRVFWRALVAGVWGAWQEFWIAPASTAQGSILYRGASGVSVLAPGTALQTLKMNAGATAPEWVSASSNATIFQTLPVGTGTTVETNTFNANKSYFFEIAGVRHNGGASQELTAAFFGITAAAYSSSALIVTLNNGGYNYGEMTYLWPGSLKKVHAIRGCAYDSATVPGSNSAGSPSAGRVGVCNWGTAQGVSKLRFGLTGATNFVDGNIIIWEY